MNIAAISLALDNAIDHYTHDRFSNNTDFYIPDGETIGHGNFISTMAQCGIKDQAKFMFHLQYRMPYWFIDLLELFLSNLPSETSKFYPLPLLVGLKRFAENSGKCYAGTWRMLQSHIMFSLLKSLDSYIEDNGYYNDAYKELTESLLTYYEQESNGMLVPIGSQIFLECGDSKYDIMDNTHFLFKVKRFFEQISSGQVQPALAYVFLMQVLGINQKIRSGEAEPESDLMNKCFNDLFNIEELAEGF